MASQLVGSFHTRNAALQAMEELAALGFDVEMLKVEHQGSRAALFRLVLRIAQGGVIGAALALVTVFVVPSEFLLPIMVIGGAAGAFLNVRLTRPRELPVEVEDATVQALVVVQGADIETATMILKKEGSTAVRQIEAHAEAQTTDTA